MKSFRFMKSSKGIREKSQVNIVCKDCRSHGWGRFFVFCRPAVVSFEDLITSVSAR